MKYKLIKKTKAYQIREYAVAGGDTITFRLWESTPTMEARMEVRFDDGLARKYGFKDRDDLLKQNPGLMAQVEWLGFIPDWFVIQNGEPVFVEVEMKRKIIAYLNSGT